MSLKIIKAIEILEELKDNDWIEENFEGSVKALELAIKELKEGVEK
jgi:hypothetical protein